MPQPRRGVGLVEVVIAAAILGGVFVAIARFIGVFSTINAQSTSSLVASDLAVARVEQVKAGTRYDSLETWFGLTEQNAGGMAGYQRVTRVSRTLVTGVAAVDYKRVTVVVTSPRLAAPVRKTIIISEF